MEHAAIEHSAVEHSAIEQGRHARAAPLARAWRGVATAHRFITAALYAGVILSAVSCDIGPRGRADLDTAHATYARALRDAGLAETVMGRDWLTAADSVLRSPLEITVPYREDGAFSRGEARAVGYRLRVPAGRVVTAVVVVSGRPMQLFVDLFEPSTDSVPTFIHRRTGLVDSTSRIDSSDARPFLRTYAHTISFEAREPTTLILRLQPELLRDGRYQVEVSSEPILGFPVSGGSNRSVQSFYGADRDGGRREHHGIDIFAPRGTPVIAAVNGVVRSLAPNTLGGTVVWLFDAQRSLMLYHAHLDRHVMREGQAVRIGDTLGFVGNTGNAKTTAPHLHFGIYQRPRGAIDPWPWVQRAENAAPLVVADTALLGSDARAKRSGIVVRGAARGGADVLRTLSRGTRVQIKGASATWYRVELEDGVAGYLPAQSVSPPR